MNIDDHSSLDLCFDELLTVAQASIKADIADELVLIKPDFPALLAEMQRCGVDIDNTPLDDNNKDNKDNKDGRGRRDSLVLVAEDGKGAARSTTSGAAFRLLEEESAESDTACSDLLGVYDQSNDPLVTLTSDARLEIEADIAARRLLPIPDFAMPAVHTQGAESSNSQSTQNTQNTQSEHRIRWLGAALAIAAATLLIWGLGPALARPLLGGPTASQAQWSEREATTRGRASAHGPNEKLQRAPLKAKAKRAEHRTLPQADPNPAGANLDASPPDDTESESDLPPEQTPTQNPAQNPEPALDKDRGQDPSAAAKRTATTSRTRTGKRAQSLNLDLLEAKAESLWRAGDRESAITLLRTIIRRARGQRRADLAYGDLFTITRQLHGREREAAVWREYLERFPRGRYADDARAGLCRRMTNTEARSCWSSYALDFADGSHRLEADRASDE